MAAGCCLKKVYCSQVRDAFYEEDLTLNGRMFCKRFHKECPFCENDEVARCETCRAMICKASRQKFVRCLVCGVTAPPRFIVVDAPPELSGGHRRGEGGGVMIEYVHRVVYCSERKNRCRREEITVTGTDMMVTRVEELPLHYDAAVERLRSPGEALIFTRGGLRYWSGYQGCPFCRNREVIFCPACERYSCWNRQKEISICAWCGKIGEPVNGPGLPLSESGRNELIEK